MLGERLFEPADWETISEGTKVSRLAAGGLISEGTKVSLLESVVDARQHVPILTREGLCALDRQVEESIHLLCAPRCRLVGVVSARLRVHARLGRARIHERVVLGVRRDVDALLVLLGQRHEERWRLFALELKLKPFRKVCQLGASPDHFQGVVVATRMSHLVLARGSHFVFARSVRISESRAHESRAHERYQ